MKTVLALAFHKINQGSENFKSPRDPFIGRYSITTEKFKQVINMVPAERCCTVSEYFKKERGDWLILTFDDGFASDFEAAFPILESKGIKATFFITSRNLGVMGYLNVSHLIEMIKGGMEVGSHGLTHRYLITMKKDEVIHEIRESKERLEQISGRKVISFAPVGGHYKKWMKDVAYESGYKVFVTMIPGRTNSGEDNFLLHRNHIQAHHDLAYVSKLVNGDRYLLSKNKIRYTLLRIPKVIFGIKNYDLVKRHFSRILCTH